MTGTTMGDRFNSLLLWSKAIIASVCWQFAIPCSTQLVVVDAFHDCVQSQKRAKNRGDRRSQIWHEEPSLTKPSASTPASQLSLAPPFSCDGGLCVGMTDGPHQGGNASYPIAWNGTAGTRVHSE